MWRKTKKLKSVEDLIIYEKAENFTGLGNSKNIHGMALQRAFSEGLVHQDGPAAFVPVLCKEHDRYELVSRENFRFDLKLWYEADLHPRFSLMGALIRAGQHSREIELFLGPSWRFWGIQDSFRENQKMVRQALKETRTEEEFIEKLRSRLFVTLPLGRRRHRVPAFFKERFEQKNFTVRDFFREGNQEYRRIMLRILPIAEVLKGLKLVAEDGEGKLYDMKEPSRDEILVPEVSKYLYVRCPSTGQEYLLSVPHHMKTPKEARRWTFNLHPKDEFVKEA